MNRSIDYAEIEEEKKKYAIYSIQDTPTTLLRMCNLIVRGSEKKTQVKLFQNIYVHTIFFSFRILLSVLFSIG